MTALVVVVLLGVVLLVAQVTSEHVRIPPPVLQLLCGIALGFVPRLREVELPPEVVLVLILPVLLYWESLRTGLRTVRANLRVIVLLSTVLVAVTAAVVAVVAHASGMDWGPAWVLGAALAPTDATAAAALTRRLPRRMVTTLRTESLVNDGTALVIYGVAVAATVGTHAVTVPYVAGSLAVSYLGGVASGVVVGLLSNAARRRLDDSLTANVNSLLAPFAAYLAAEAWHASGVLAVVTCGLIALRKAPRYGRASGRHQRDAFWTLAVFVLNGTLFCFIGIEAQAAAWALSGADLRRGLVLVAAVTGVTIGVRFAWLFTTPYLLRVVDRRPQQRRLRMGAGARFVYVVAGFRGAVSMAAALGVPRTTSDGSPFPQADLLVFVASGVIVLSLGQALVMPAVVRWAHLPPDDSREQENALATSAMLHETLGALDGLAAHLHVDPHVTARLRDRYAEHARAVDDTDDSPLLHERHAYRRLALAALHHERDVLLRLRDEDRIDDDVLVDIQGRLDLEELRFETTDRT
ncbi:Na+/H+ antiporter [Jatrophihabitans sp. YIM 134969]